MPVPLLSLWMPIVASAIAVFVVSSLVHMVFKWHASDYRGLSNEDEVREVLKRSGLKPGSYFLPYCKDMKETTTPAMVAKFTEGPVGHLVVAKSGPPAMGRYLGSWFAYCLLVSFFVAYLAAHTIAPGTPYLSVFQVVGTVAFMTYGLSALVDSIWKQQPLTPTVKHMVDGLLYALVTAGCFGWLWPN